MRTVHKYQLDGGLTVITAPEGAQWLHMADQHGNLVIWAEVDTDRPGAEHRIWVAGTGHPLPDLPIRYIDSAVCDGGNYVFHAYEEIQ